MAGLFDPDAGPAPVWPDAATPAPAACRVVSWNILHGGGHRVPEIALTLLDLAPDMVVLQEFRPARGGGLRAVLSDHGLPHQLATSPAGGANSLLIASRRPIVPDPEPTPGDDLLHTLPADLEAKWLVARAPDFGLILAAVHVPDDSRPTAKALFWQHIVAVARRRRHEPLAFVGDFNTGRHRADEPDATFGCTRHLGTLCTLGFADAWRHITGDHTTLEGTWMDPSGSAFRVDAAMVADALLPRVRSARYCHGPRERRISDHSALVVDFSAHAAAAAIDANRAPGRHHAPHSP